MNNSFRHVLGGHLLNARGWSTPQKLVVLQSDDWGAIRTSGQAALKDLSGRGIPVEKCHYTSLDALEGEIDLQALYEVLESVRDRDGNPAKLTANCLVANPDFEKIESDDFEHYSFEPVTKTFARYQRTGNCFDLWNEGRSHGIFFPQSHSREHFHVPRWMQYLRSGDRLFRLLFSHNMYALSAFLIPGKPASYLSALRSAEATDADDRQFIVHDALRIFKELNGVSSRSFIAPNYVWDSVVEKALADSGVRFIQSSSAQQLAAPEGGKHTRRRYLGQSNSLGQLYIVRNVHFEPASDPSIDWVGRCLDEVERAFLWRTPAVISSHRVNFIGALDEKNRQRGTSMLKQFLRAIVKKWPAVKFLTTEELGDLMLKKGAGA